MKETEFDRYDRMKKLERELEKRKLTEANQKSKSEKTKSLLSQKKQNWNQVYALAIGDEDYDEYDEMSK